MIEYSLDNALIEKINIMIERCVQIHPKKDAVLLNEGGEGEGKSNSSVAEAYYIKTKTNREIHLFFRLEKLIEFAQSTEGMIIIWDEPALEGLSADHYKELLKNLIRLLMTARKKRHFFIINLTKFFKFPEYIVVDRALGMVHMYSRREIESGRFVYIRKKHLEPLWNAYKTSKKRLYKKFASIRGTFPDVMEKYFTEMDINVEGIPHATYEDYEREKDKAIMSIGRQDRANKDKKELMELKQKIGQIKFPITKREDFAKAMSMSIRTLQLWAKISLKTTEFDTPSISESEQANIYNNKGLSYDD